MECLNCKELSFLSNLFPEDSKLCPKCIQWKKILLRFPYELQQEIMAERFWGDREDIRELQNWKLQNPDPIEIPLETLLQNKFNLNLLCQIPLKPFSIINTKWHLNLVHKGENPQIRDGSSGNPGRFTSYWKRKGSTAPPSVLVNGQVYWGVARFVAALGRGDGSLRVWNISKEKK